MKKPGRNDPCSCGSGKKFKKCCESQMMKGRFRATLADLSLSLETEKTSRLVSVIGQELLHFPQLRGAEMPQEEVPSELQEPPTLPKEEGCSEEMGTDLP